MNWYVLRTPDLQLPPCIAMMAGAGASDAGKYASADSASPPGLANTKVRMLIPDFSFRNRIRSEINRSRLEQLFRGKRLRYESVLCHYYDDRLQKTCRGARHPIHVVHTLD